MPSVTNRGATYRIHRRTVYNAERLTNILRNVSDIIGAHILNVASQDYDPQGASVTILISEEEVHDADVSAISIRAT